SHRRPPTLSRRTLLRGAAVAGAGALAATPFLLASTANAFAWGRTLKQGLSGSDVLELQIRVAGWASDSAAKTRVSLDGDFGPGTAAAVKRFQRAYGLAADAVVGPNTRAKLNALESSDGSTAHFNFSEFTDRSTGTFSGGKLSAAATKE